MHTHVGTAIYLNLDLMQQSMNAFSFLTKNIDIYFTAHTFVSHTHISQTHRRAYTHKSKSVRV